VKTQTERDGMQLQAGDARTREGEKEAGKQGWKDGEVQPQLRSGAAQKIRRRRRHLRGFKREAFARRSAGRRNRLCMFTEITSSSHPFARMHNYRECLAWLGKCSQFCSYASYTYLYSLVISLRCILSAYS
jgi:hypothetical protein